MSVKFNRDYAIIQTQWNGIDIEIRWDADYCSYDDDHVSAHLEIRSINPERVALPITETGYLSHFIHRSHVEHAGGPEAYVMAWIAEKAGTLAWKKAEVAASQYALF